MVIQSLYGLSHVDPEFFTQVKAKRKPDAPLQRCMQCASSSTVYTDSTSMLKHTSSSAEWIVVLVVSPLCS